MSAIKRACLVTAFLLIALPALAATGVRYSTVPVALGAFKRISSFQGSILYLNTQSIAVYDPDARLLELLVTPGDRVEAGDPVATYTLPASATGRKEAELTLRAARDDFEYELAARQSEIEEMKSARAAETDETRARILDLRIEKSALTLEAWRAGAEANLAGLEAAYQSALTAGDAQTLYAGIAGVVDSTQQLEPGALVAGKSLVVLRDPEQALVRVSDPAGELKYGMEAELRLSGSSGQATVKGTVVAADNVRPGELRDGTAAIACDQTPSAAYNAATAFATTMYVKDVLVVPSQAISYKDGHSVVSILTADGTVQTRYVVKAMDTGSEAWIALGAQDGDKLMTK